MYKFVLLLFLCNSVLCATQKPTLEGFVAKGDFSYIEDFPHSACLDAVCDRHWFCGASVLNQRVLLTAAHCVYGCGFNSKLYVSVGNINRSRGTTVLIHKFIAHEKYKEKSMTYDIALIAVIYPLKLDADVSRIAIIRNPPKDEVASIAGWGFLEEERQISTRYLVNTTQNIMSQRECMRALNTLIPGGMICAKCNENDKSFITKGDSGSALVIRGYIQIGVVHGKFPKVQNIILYSDIGYHYKWIRINAHKLGCVDEDNAILK